MVTQDAGPTARQLASMAEDVCRHLLPKGHREGRYWQVGDVSGAPGRSLYVCLVGPRAGKWTDAATGEHGDLLDLIALNQGLSLRDAIREAQVFLRLPPTSRADEPTQRDTGTPASCRRLFAASQPVRGTLAARYLAGRGIVLVRAELALRFHPHCHRREAHGRVSLPALIAAVTNDNGQLRGLHRTWLAPDGGKALVDGPRRAMGQLAGYAVRLGAAGPVMAAGEGLETTLSLRMAFPRLPAVAALSAPHLSAWTFPAALRRLYVACDADAAGRWALAKLLRRGLDAGLEVLPLHPRLDDFNSDLMAFGLAELRDWIASQLAGRDAAAFLPGE
ncbi:Toprim domain-containing protein [Nitrospirillum amazonense]|uniref:Toprim domain-containing protein n=1 Tax=Nitrospirillum amazonense TaxID=28077 RepID=A0A560J474_9PROT|nr:toprim domain-containing protein [Nitrospirillum amazonense]TWB66042.1 Toprim domain-containing protein [Nitrospirillum amazonense]